MRDILVRTDRGGSQSDLADWLGKLGFHVVIASDRQEFEDGLERRPELLLIDVGTRGLNVSKLCEALRQDPYTAEIPLLLYGREDEISQTDITASFDDFVCLPASEAEIHARIRRVLWRRKRMDTEELVVVDDLVINLAKYEVTVGGEPVTLTLKEYELLRFLATHPGRVFSREYLLSQIWGLDYYGGMRTVDVHVRRLRAKLETGGQGFIETVRGAGYRFRS